MSSLQMFIQEAAGTARVAFLGACGASQSPDESLSKLLGVPVLFNRQVHSDRVIEVASAPLPRGPVAEADGLFTTATGVGLAVVTADCVPVLLASAAGVAAVHAGWRGLAAGILARAVDKFRRDSAGGPTVAWIGPAIGVCCYEVGHDVATAVARASSGASSVRPPPAGSDRGRPYLDLRDAARTQLRAAGVEAVRTMHRCTKCDRPDSAPGPLPLGNSERGLEAGAEAWPWSSYRRSAKAASRNLACIWRLPD